MFLSSKCGCKLLHVFVYSIVGWGSHDNLSRFADSVAKLVSNKSRTIIVTGVFSRLHYTE